VPEAEKILVYGNEADNERREEQAADYFIFLLRG
jgi:hypothetical protein